LEGVAGDRRGRRDVESVDAGFTVETTGALDPERIQHERTVEQRRRDEYVLAYGRTEDAFARGDAVEGVSVA
jgi:hypothetical protein